MPRRFSKEGYQVVVVGEKKHPEVQSILGYAGDNAVVVETAEDVEGIRVSNPAGRCRPNYAIVW